jgi:3-oxoacyl-[acyl-carrier protein] reductase
MSVAVDVADDEWRRAPWRKRSRARFGRVDSLVNNASIFSTSGWARSRRSRHRVARLIEVNLTEASSAARRSPGLRAPRRGRSSNLLRHRPDGPRRLRALRDVEGGDHRDDARLANELGGDGVRVNSIMPGSVETEVPRDTVTPSKPRRS